VKARIKKKKMKKYRKKMGINKVKGKLFEYE
jgi:hypothetical protein